MGFGRQVEEKYLLMVSAVRTEAWSGGKLLLDAAVDAGGEMQLNVEPGIKYHNARLLLNKQYAILITDADVG